MGRTYDEKHPRRPRYSLKRRFVKRRMLKRLVKMQVDLEAQNKSTDPSTSVVLLRDVTNSEINNEMMTHFHQIKEEQMDSNGEKIEAYNEKDVLNETIEYCTHQDFIFVNANNVVKTEDYKEEDYEEKDSMLNQNIEYPVDTKDTIDNNCFVDTHSTRKNIPTGRFIVDFSFIWSEIQRIFNDHARGLDCQFKYWKLANCRRCGFLTQFFFKCEMCHYEASIWSEPVGTKTSDINAAAVTASVATGMGFSKLMQLFTSMDITYM